MKTKLLLLFLLFAFAGKSQTFNYRGVGILKVVEGDTVHILPKYAFVINQDLYELTFRALAYVENNSGDSLIDELQKKLRFLENEIAIQSANYGNCIQDKTNLINESRIRIKKIELLVEKQKYEIGSLEETAKAKDKLLEKSKAKSRRRTAILFAPITILAAKLGYDHWFK
jgi:hypothetical protein